MISFTTPEEKQYIPTGGTAEGHQVMIYAVNKDYGGYNQLVEYTAPPPDPPGEAPLPPRLYKNLHGLPGIGAGLTSDDPAWCALLGEEPNRGLGFRHADRLARPWRVCRRGGSAGGAGPLGLTSVL